MSLPTEDNIRAALATVNDPEMADYVARVAKRVVGPDRYFPVPRPSMGGEDFAYYLEKVPG